MKKLLLLLLIVSTNQLFCQKSHEIIRADAVNGDGICVAKIVDHRWGFVNWTNGEVIEPIEMANYKDIDSFGRVVRKQEC